MQACLIHCGTRVLLAFRISSDQRKGGVCLYRSRRLSAISLRQFLNVESHRRQRTTNRHHVAVAVSRPGHSRTGGETDLE